MNFFKGDTYCNCIYLVLVKMIDLVGNIRFAKFMFFATIFLKKEDHIILSL